MRRHAPSLLLILMLMPLLLSSCGGDGGILSPAYDRFRIAGRLTLDVEGCAIVKSEGGVYNVASWRDHAPFGSQVELVVERKKGYISWCSGEIVDVIRVLSVTINFRTDPVTGAETWGPDQGPIVIGQVDVEPGGSLTILPGTKVRIIPEGWLRVRGSILIKGAEGDSVSIASTDSSSVYMIPKLNLAGSSADSRLRYLSAPALDVQNADIRIENSSLLSVEARGGSVTLTRCTVGSVFTDETRVEATESTIQDLNSVYANVVLENDRLRSVVLSYSSGTARRCTFAEPLAYVVFHGASGGQFEQNNFFSATTHIEVRHTSNPVFTSNNFLSPTMVVDLESYQLTDCVSMIGNWWGTSSESEIRAKLDPSGLVCYSPWSSGPIP